MLEFIKDLEKELGTNRLQLPSLPQVAIRIRNLVDNQNTTPADLAKAVALDPALAARVLRAANSVLYYRGDKPIEDVSQATVRLGRSLLSHMVNVLVVEQLYQASHVAAIKKPLTLLWKHSIRVAALSHVLASRFTKLSPEQAMLAGLTHDIGSLYLLQRIHDQAPELFDGDEELPKMLLRLHPEVGAKILDSWAFNEELVAVAREHETYERNTGEDDADMVDVVLVSNLHARLAEKRPSQKLDWSRVSAFKRLRLDPGKSIEVIRQAGKEIAAIEKLLGG